MISKCIHKVSLLIFLYCNILDFHNSHSHEIQSRCMLIGTIIKVKDFPLVNIENINFYIESFRSTLILDGLLSQQKSDSDT